MLTRLKVSGFKNLVDVDVRFGPFTCIAGANGTGKSNLFDAIHFLSALADDRLVEAARSVRESEGRTADIRSLFHRVGDDYDDRMSLQAEMVISEEGLDDLGQPARATTTFLRYSVTLAYRKEQPVHPLGPLELVSEELVHIKRTDAFQHLLFPHSASQWRDTAVKGKRSGGPFISTEASGEDRVIRLHQDGGSRGRAVPKLASSLPRTVLAGVNGAESPTALLVRREMQSWRRLQLEPSALRRPDEFAAPPRLDANGSHLAAALYHLARLNRHPGKNGASPEEIAEQTYSQIANRLAELLDDVHEVRVDRDERRELLTLQVAGRDRTWHPARALSDGTLRFLALAVIELDPETRGLLCLEEPENGIHPARIPAMLRLLQDICTDVTEPIDPDNPLRQVIVNTHSPVVVGEVPDDSLLVVELQETVKCGSRFKRAVFGCLPDTWRQNASDPMPVVPKGRLLAYLNPILPRHEVEEDDGHLPLDQLVKSARRRRRRVVDRPDLQFLLPLPQGSE